MDSVILKLFTAKAGTSPSRETAVEMDHRAPLSPISVRSQNEVAAGAHQQQQEQGVQANHVHPAFSPTSQGPKKSPMPLSSLSQKNPSVEYGENIATFPPGTPEHKFAAPSTPKSSSKKRFRWSNIRQQLHQDEEQASGTVLIFPLASETS